MIKHYLLNNIAISSLLAGLAVAAQPQRNQVAPADWKQIRAEYELHRHSATPDRGGFRARNPGQQWLTRFDGRGFTVEPNQQSWRWGLDLISAGYAGTESAISGRAEAVSDKNRVTYRWPSGIEEWYVNGTQGLEHGFTIRERPKGKGDRLRLTLSVRGGLRPAVDAAGQQAAFTGRDGSAVLTYSKLLAWDANGKHLPARMETGNGGLVLSVDTAAARFPVTIDPIAQSAYLKASNTGAGDEFGSAITVSGNTVVIGAPFEDSNGTGVNSNAQADNSAADSGAAYVFVQNSGVWTQQAYLKASNTAAGASFGRAVSLSGDTLVVGAPIESNSGAAYVFVRSGTTWSQQAFLKPAVIDPGDGFGWSAGVSGDTIVIGAPYEDSNGTGINSGAQGNNSASESGALYVYQRSGNSWPQQAYIKAANTGVSDTFGTAVAISGDTIVAGAPREDSNGRGVNTSSGADNSSADSGAAYVFVRAAGTWTQQAYLKSSNSDANDNFAVSVAIDIDTILVGAPGESSSGTGVNSSTEADNSAREAGAVYVFLRAGTTWTQQAYIKASNTSIPPQGQPGDNFGFSVAISGNNAIAGAMLEDSNGTGVNSNTQSNESAVNAGAAYLFLRSGSTWAQTAYLKASNTEAVDLFGARVAISPEVAIVGAGLEDSSSVGISGSGTDNSAINSGAAYVYQLNAWAVSGSPQSAQVNTPFTLPLQVTVVDALGNPITGATVNYTVPSTGASATLSSPTAVTNGSGVATVNATANGTAGSYAVAASVAGQTSSGVFFLTNTGNSGGAGAPNAPVLVSPAQGSTVTNTIVNFVWNAVAGATSYEFRLKEASSTQIFRVTLLAGNTNAIYTFPSGNYRWEMEACNQNGCSPTSVATFVIQGNSIPTQAPAGLGCTVVNDTGQNRLNCNWTAAPNSDFHFINVVQPNSGPGGGALTVAGGQVGGTSISILIPDGQANVIVRGCTGDGCGPFTAAFPINPAFGNPTVPILGEPFGGSAYNSGNNAPLITFSWNRVAGDNGSNFTYRLYVQDFSRNRAALDVLTTSNFYGAYVNPGTRYDALVIAIPNGGGAQRQGPPSAFLVRGAVPNAPIATEPTYGSTVTRDSLGRVHIAWTPIINADGTVSTRLYQYFYNTPSPVTGVTTAISADPVFPVGTFVGIMRACTTGTSCTANSDVGWGPWNNAPGSQGGQGLLTVQ